MNERTNKFFINEGKGIRLRERERERERGGGGAGGGGAGVNIHTTHTTAVTFSVTHLLFVSPASACTNNHYLTTFYSGWF